MFPSGAGMLATKCMRKAPTKVMLVQGHQPQPFRTVLARVDFSEASPEFQRHYRLLMKQRLKEYVGDTAGLDTRFTVFDAPRHGCGIAEYARHVQADLVVLGTKGRTTVGYVLLGSTVERLLRDLPCSVLTVRASNAKTGSAPARTEPACISKNAEPTPTRTNP